MATGIKDGDQGAKSRRTKHLGGRSSSVVGGGLVVSIATVVVVGVAGKLLSRLRKPNGSTSNNNSITPTDSLDEIVNGEHPELLVHLEDGNLPPDAAVINEKSVTSSLDLSGSKDKSTTSDEEGHPDSTHNDLYIGTSTKNIVDKNYSPDLLHSDSGFITKQIKEAKDGDDLSTASTALSELVNNALLDAKHDNPSKHELLNNTKALQDGIAGVISRAFENFSYGDISSDELTPTKVNLTVSWETNSYSGSEEEASAQVHPDGDLVAEKELLLLGSTKAGPDVQIMKRINLDAPASQDEEVPSESLPSSSAPSAEQEEEPKGTTAENETEREPLQEEAGSSFAGSQGATPEVVALEVEQEKIESERSGVPVKDDIREVASLLDDITTISLTATGSRNDAEAVKKQNAFQAQTHANNQAEIFTLTSILLKSTESPPTGITAAKALDSVQISTKITEKKEGTPVTETSLVVGPSTSHETTNITKIVAKESAVAAGTSNTAVVTTVEFVSNTAQGLKRELQENSRGNRWSLEVLGLAVIVALVAVLFWSIRTPGNPSVPRL